MDEGGHYYTVYYTSLAVGFKEKIAHRHALLSQMADEVQSMDAAEVQKAQCLNYNIPNLQGDSFPVNPDWRITVQKSHSLSGKSYSELNRSSAFQRSFTSEALLKLNPLSLEFGLLLHRLGDTYAHSKIDDPSTTYTISTYKGCADNISITSNHGHLHHGHSPDYAFLRPEIFNLYLENLYDILSKKVQEFSLSGYKRNNASMKSLPQVRFAFEDIFRELAQRTAFEERRLHALEIYTRGGFTGQHVPHSHITDSQRGLWFMQMIRSSADRTLQVPLREYKPEDHSNLTLAAFLRQHPELAELDITARQIEDIFKRSSPPDGHEKNDDEFVLSKYARNAKDKFNTILNDNPVSKVVKEQLGNMDKGIRKIYRVPGG
jgi:hypothetical protein